jgi:Gas vesicle synthesis protein GvpO
MHDELETETGLESMTKAELQAEARARRLFAGGTKESLLRRIMDDDNPKAPNGQVAEDEGQLPATDEGDVGGRSDEGDVGGRSDEGDVGGRSDEGDVGGRSDEGDVGGRSDEAASQGDRPDGVEPGKLAELVTTATESLGRLTGREIDTVSGIRATDDGYRVTVEVVELSRMPTTTDVLATYEVDVNAGGHVTGFARSHRYCRNQTSKE